MRKDDLMIGNDNMLESEFVDFCAKAFENAKEAMRPGKAFYIWHAAGKIGPFIDACEKADLTIRQQIIWVKQQFTFGRQDYQWRHEPCLYGWTDGAAHYFINERDISTVIEDSVDFSKMKKADMQALLEQIFSEEFPTTVLHEDRPMKSGEHPTMKPVKLMARLIHNSTRPGEIVLDIFGGSGSTMIAAEQLKRPCYMAELEPHYCDVIVDRWEKYTGKQATLNV